MAKFEGKSRVYKTCSWGKDRLTFRVVSGAIFWVTILNAGFPCGNLLIKCVYNAGSLFHHRVTRLDVEVLASVLSVDQNTYKTASSSRLLCYQREADLGRFVTCDGINNQSADPEKLIDPRPNWSVDCAFFTKQCDSCVDSWLLTMDVFEFGVLQLFPRYTGRGKTRNQT